MELARGNHLRHETQLERLVDGNGPGEHEQVLGQSRTDEPRERLRVFDWPILHGPSGPCYNADYTNRIVRNYRTWLAVEARRLGRTFIDLSRTVLPRDFLDTRHASARGQRKIASALAPYLEPVLRRRMKEVLPAAQPH